jgi:hypothetical protein
LFTGSFRSFLLSRFFVRPQLNPDLVSLDLSGNRIGDAGASALADALRSHTTLQSLNVSRNRIGDAGCVAIGDALAAAADSHLVHLDVSGNNRGLVQLYPSDDQSLVSSPPLSPLSPHRFGSASVRAPGQLLFTATQPLLQSQSLQSTQQRQLPGIGPLGAAALSRALSAPRCVLNTLNLTDLARIGDDGARALARGLAANQVLLVR